MKLLIVQVFDFIDWLEKEQFAHQAWTISKLHLIS